MILSPANTDKTPDDITGNRDQNGNSDETRQPFDTSDLDQIPSTTREDPPYRDWWVIDLP